MIKIVFIIDTLETGGAERSLVEIAIRFKKVIPVFIHVYKGSSLKDELIKNGIEVYSLDIEKKFGFNLAVKKMLPVISEINPAIIHSTLSRSDIIARKIKQKINLPLVNSLVSNSYHSSRYSRFSFSRKIKHGLVQFLDLYTAPKVDLFISNSMVIKEDNMKALNLSPEKVKVIPRGRESKNFFFSKEESLKLKKELGVEDKRIILNVGRLIESKGQCDLIRAFSEIAQEHPETVILIAGEGPFRKHIEQEIERFKLKDQVILLGSRNDVPHLLSIADVFAFSSYLEGLPGSLIEAMMSKTLIICSDIAENRECVPENAAVFYKTGDIKQLRNRLTWYLNGSSSGGSIVERAYEYACRHYELDNIVSRYEETYLKLLKT